MTVSTSIGSGSTLGTIGSGSLYSGGGDSGGMAASRFAFGGLLSGF